MHPPFAFCEGRHSGTHRETETGCNLHPLILHLPVVFKAGSGWSQRRNAAIPCGRQGSEHFQHPLSATRLCTGRKPDQKQSHNSNPRWWLNRKKHQHWSSVWAALTLGSVSSRLKSIQIVCVCSSRLSRKWSISYTSPNLFTCNCSKYLFFPFYLRSEYHFLIQYNFLFYSIYFCWST